MTSESPRGPSPLIIDPMVLAEKAAKWRAQQATHPPVEPSEKVGQLEYALVRSYHATDKGYQRKNNEDYAVSWEPATPPLRQKYGDPFTSEDETELTLGNLYVVADGVGGLDRGEVASKQGSWDIINGYVNSGEKDPKAALEKAIAAANNTLYETGFSGSGRMAATLACAVVRGQELYVAHLGDSRVYLLREGQLRQLTPDHSWTAAIERGEKTLEEYQSSDEKRRGKTPRRSEIYLSLGAFENIQLSEIMQGPIPLEQGDRLLLCTDGLWEPVPEGTIKQILETDKNLQEATMRLVWQALENGGPDNIGVLVVEISGFGSQPQISTL